MVSKHKGADIVFDAEPLLAYLEDETGSGHVEEYLDKIESDDLTAAISPIQQAEVIYVADRLGSKEVATSFFSSLEQIGMKITPAEKVTLSAAEFKSAGHSLGDSYALATAEWEIATLIVGADSDFHIDTEGEAFNIERIRAESV